MALGLDLINPLLWEKISKFQIVVVWHTKYVHVQKLSTTLNNLEHLQWFALTCQENLVHIRKIWIELARSTLRLSSNRKNDFKDSNYLYQFLSLPYNNFHKNEVYGKLGNRPSLHLFDCNMFFESAFQSIGNGIHLLDP